MEEQLAAQQQQLLQSQKQAEELLSKQSELQKSNEYYREQTSMLMAENENLMLKLEKMEQDRKAIIQKLIMAVTLLIVLLVIYACSVRIWRYIVWRKQGRPRSVQLP